MYTVTSHVAKSSGVSYRFKARAVCNGYLGKLTYLISQMGEIKLEFMSRMTPWQALAGPGRRGCGMLVSQNKPQPPVYVPSRPSSRR